MLPFFKLIFLLIHIDKEGILNWFGIMCSSTIMNLNEQISFTTISIGTIDLIVKELWNYIQEGLTLADVETLLIFSLFIRFIILTIRYNLKTSFYITSIGIFAGYLWYRHLIDLIAMYRNLLIKLPYLNKLGIDSIQLNSMNNEMSLINSKLGGNVRWYNPGQLIYDSVVKGIIAVDYKSGMKYYIDPISMIVSSLSEEQKLKIIPVYYKLYNSFIPQFFAGISKFWNQLSGIAAYAIITRIGKKYCPYLVRWHWTFLLIIGFIEQILIFFCYRVAYFQSNILIPQLANTDINLNLAFQINFLTALLTLVISFHLGLILFGLFHAIWGQYFYFPFFVENTELHIGLRPKTSIYSGGNTAWQDETNQNIKRISPRLWYGWFGGGTQTRNKFIVFFQNLIIKILIQFRHFFQK